MYVELAEMAIILTFKKYSLQVKILLPVCSTFVHESGTRYQKKYILVSECIYDSKNSSSQCNIILQIERVEDKNK